MMEKVFISRDDTATFICPECGKTKTADVARYKNMDKVIRVKIKCPCGYSYSVVLEKRRHYRKETNFPGVFTLTKSGKFVDKGRMTVLDLSQSGIKIKLNVMPGVEVGDTLQVEFNLDDKTRTLVRKDTVVRGIFGMKMGLEFVSVNAADPNDKAIGFYLMR